MGFLVLRLFACKSNGFSSPFESTMTHGRRVERVAALIRNEVSQLLINGIRDERIHLGMITITNVEVSGDLQHCKIFVSIYG